MNTEIYLVRHGETTWNALGKFQGVKDIPLSENGITQAEFLKEHKCDMIQGYYFYRPMPEAELRELLIN